MCLVKDEKTVGALQGVWIGLNLFYAGFVVLPQNFFSFFWLGLWINASRYALEGSVLLLGSPDVALILLTSCLPSHHSEGLSSRSFKALRPLLLQPLEARFGFSWIVHLMIKSYALGQ